MQANCIAMSRNLLGFVSNGYEQLLYHINVLHVGWWAKGWFERRHILGGFTKAGHASTMWNWGLVPASNRSPYAHSAKGQEVVSSR